jgi:hypothetical protein
MNLYFYNLFHNSDIHLSRNFVKDIIEKTNYTDYYYVHTLDVGILKDITNLIEISDIRIKYNNFYYENIVGKLNGDMHINTWIGQKNYTENGINIYTYYNMFKDIYEKLEISINEDPLYYLPSIDFDKINKDKIDEFVKEHNNKKALISNGGVLSEQSYARFDLERVIENYPNIDFILTKKEDINLPNVFYTDDIIQLKYPDLLEISYLSTFCDYIIGRESGPYTFCNITNNFNRRVKMISFAITSDWSFYKNENVLNFKDIETTEILINLLQSTKLSIITGTLNRIEHIKRVIENTVDSCGDLELILIDGGSTDGTIEYIKELNHSRINLIEVGQRSSYPHFMNLGLKASKNEWIAQWNDDVLLINDWNDVLELIEKNTHDVYIFDWTRGSINDFKRGDTNVDPSSFGSYWINFSHCMNFGVYRKRIFREIGMYDSKFKYYECDHDMTTRCALFGYRLINSHQIKVFEIMTEKRSLNYNDDVALYANNLYLYRQGLLPETIEKL